MKPLATTIALALAAGSAYGGVIFAESFDTATLGQMTYTDYLTDGASAFEWTNNEAQGLGNFTGGTGSAAMSHSDAVFGAFDHAIVTPEIVLPEDRLVLSFVHNYQNFAHIDIADVDITTDGGSSWINLHRFNEDHGGFYEKPGKTVLLNLTAYAGESVRIRFRHTDLTEDALDWYWQVDNIAVETAIPAPGALALLGAAGLIAAGRRR
jgi:hypothetical protein